MKIEIENINTFEKRKSKYNSMEDNLRSSRRRLFQGI